MKIKDKYGTVIFLKQAKNGKIIIPLGEKYVTLSKEDSEKFTLYNIEDFDLDEYYKAYK